MLIIGAKGFAKEVIEVLHQSNYPDEIYLFDDVHAELTGKLWNKYPILKTVEEVRIFFAINAKFAIGIGNPLLRSNMYDKFTALGGHCCSVISPFAHIGLHDNNIGEGSCIMTGSVITSSVTLGQCALINLHTTIGHDSTIGDFVELSPGVRISGNCRIGDYVSIGSNASVIPRIHIGSNVVIGAGSVITQNIPDNSLVVGVPGKVVRTLDPI